MNATTPLPRENSDSLSKVQKKWIALLEDKFQQETEDDKDNKDNKNEKLEHRRIGETYPANNNNLK
ncbi:20754_t:CDS:2 [Gigaspora margarita]|uniref:20754_t:CDS:1 n=1 Tax=Gigaspora margarita TaxID=4874 RepID=A0ABN7W0T8_GIGMA|nr:20754_t:CDS:2 [Gigaspora margarita]